MKLIVVKPPLSSVLLELKTCLGSLNEAKESSLSFFAVVSKLLKVLEGKKVNNPLCSVFFADIKTAAGQVVAAESSFFSTSLKPQERKLALLFVDNDVVHLQEWINEMKNVEQLNLIHLSLLTFNRIIKIFSFLKGTLIYLNELGF